MTTGAITMSPELAATYRYIDDFVFQMNCYLFPYRDTTNHADKTSIAGHWVGIESVRDQCIICATIRMVLRKLSDHLFGPDSHKRLELVDAHSRDAIIVVRY